MIGISRIPWFLNVTLIRIIPHGIINENLKNTESQSGEVWENGQA